MGKLEKAVIVAISSDGKAEEQSKPFAVQFNPNSLKLQMSASQAQGLPPGSQQRQSTGGASTTLSLELVFDTADVGTTGSPKSVREKTAQIERFVFPTSPDESGQKQPKLRFQWGAFVFEGVATSVSVDLDHFASDGTPLRAKVALSIAEQNRAQVFRPSTRKGNAPSPLAVASASLGASAGFSATGGFGLSATAGVAAGIGASGGLGFSAGAGAQVGVALDGESLPEFSARVGLDPTAWRGLEVSAAGGASAGLSLEAGAEVGFSAGLNASAGIGVTLGAEAGATASLEGSFGLEANAGVTAVTGVGAGAELAAGFSLSAAGGLNAALETVQIVRTQAAERRAREAFTPQSGTSARNTSAPSAALATVATAAARSKPAPPEQVRRPLTLTGIPSAPQQQAASPAPPPPRVDTRATSFGFGVPLRSTVAVAAAERTSTLAGAVPLRDRQQQGLPPLADEPTVPPWEALPARTPMREASNRAQAQRRPAARCGCGCAGRCGCGGGH